MIEYIKGELVSLSPTQAVIDCQGVGYGISISLNTYTAIQGKKTCKLHIHEAIREDAHLLFGFAEEQERDLFLLLIGVSGIGGNTARMILSALTPHELCKAIEGENVAMIKTVKGIGLKTAQRVIIDLKDKINLDGVVGSNQHALSSTKVQDEAVSALTMLGFNAAASLKVVSGILSETPIIPVEQVIKLALKRL